MKFVAWLVACLARFPSGGIPGYGAWFIGTIGIAVALLSGWGDVFGESDQSARMSALRVWGGMALFGFALWVGGFIHFLRIQSTSAQKKVRDDE